MLLYRGRPSQFNALPTRCRSRKTVTFPRHEKLTSGPGLRRDDDLGPRKNPLAPDYRPFSSVRGSSIAKVRCSVGCGVAVIRPTPSGASKRCQVFCGTMIAIPALRETDCGP